MTQRVATRDPHRGPTQGIHTGDPHRGEGPTEDPPPEGRATQGTHTGHTQTGATDARGGVVFSSSLASSTTRVVS